MSTFGICYSSLLDFQLGQLKRNSTGTHTIRLLSEYSSDRRHAATHKHLYDSVHFWHTVSKSIRTNILALHFLPCHIEIVRSNSHHNDMFWSTIPIAYHHILSLSLYSNCLSQKQMLPYYIYTAKTFQHHVFKKHTDTECLCHLCNATPSPVAPTRVFQRLLVLQRKLLKSTGMIENSAKSPHAAISMTRLPFPHKLNTYS